jgi:hypothetical protein
MSAAGPADPCQGVICPNTKVVEVVEADFPTPSLGPITFSEFPVDTLNPVYAPGDYTGGPSDPRAPTVSFAAVFLGQTATTFAVTGQPTAPLTLDTRPGSQQAKILPGVAPPDFQLGNAGEITWPLAVRFSSPVAAVGVSV